MPAVSKAQQRFFGMVRATQKGEMGSPSAEVSKAATSMSKSDVKKFAKTKHKGLPNKVKVKESSDYEKLKKKIGSKKKHDTPAIEAIEAQTAMGEAYYGGEEQRKKDEKKKKIDAFMDKAMPKRTFDQMGRETDRRTGKLKEESCGKGEYYCNDRKKCMPIPKGSKVRADGMLIPETAYYKADEKYQKKLSDEDKKHKEQDKRMKFGKFYSKAKAARDTLRPGEVKRYDKTLKKWVSNKD